MRRGYRSAREAAAELGVSLPTLYAYVSRGFIRSEGDRSSRQRRYRAEDIVALKARKRRRDPGEVAEAALHFGLPVLDSAISLIAGGRLYYRGRDIASLATAATIEEVAALLWTGDPAASLPDTTVEIPAARWQRMAPLLAPLAPIEAFQVVLPLAAADDPTAYDLRPAAVQRAGVRILRLLAAVATGHKPSTAPIARTLQHGWARRTPHAGALLETALVLSADHELNPSTFTARCVASARSTPYAVVAAGLAALQGARHGGTCERIEALFEEGGTPARVEAVVGARLRRGELLPGFGHPLYVTPAGDPRASILLDQVYATRGATRGALLARALADHVQALVDVQPTIDFAMVALRRALDLPGGAAVALIAIGRAVGWIAHAIEQYQDERMIRPRARYIGPMP
ncbi:MAG: citrate synthase family protein [Deltaproteobacteria bacterium]|nr:citrate synthase family protein [Deltaproteobacteria bacterium]